MNALAALLAGLAFLQHDGLALASMGDAHPTYKACTTGCERDTCVRVVQGGWRHLECDTLCAGHTDRWLKLFRWDCKVRHTPL